MWLFIEEGKKNHEKSTWKSKNKIKILSVFFFGSHKSASHDYWNDISYLWEMWFFYIYASINSMSRFHLMNVRTSWVEDIKKNYFIFLFYFILSNEDGYDCRRKWKGLTWFSQHMGLLNISNEQHLHNFISLFSCAR